MIAISYRRQDSSPVAGRLYDRLQAEFGKGSVFMDFDSIPYGVDFREHVKQMLQRANVVVAIIGPDWSGGRDRPVRRIDDPKDFVRLEIASALENGIPIIPVLINNTPMPDAKDLPAELEGLAFRNGLELDTGIDFHHHANRLIAGIHRVIDPVVPTSPTLTPPKAVVSRRNFPLALTVAVAIALLVAVPAPWWWSKVFTPRLDKPPEKSIVTNPIQANPDPETSLQTPGLPQGYFSIQSKATGLFMDISHRESESDVVLIQSTYTRGETQMWKWLPTNDARYVYLAAKSAISGKSNQCLEIRQGGPDDQIGQGPVRIQNAYDQQWQFTQAEPGYYVITSRLTRKSIDVPNAAKTEGLPLIMYFTHGSNNQLWKLNPL